MKNNILLAVALVNLLAVASALGYVAYDPRPMKALMTGGLTEIMEGVTTSMEGGVQARTQGNAPPATGPRRPGANRPARPQADTPPPALPPGGGTRAAMAAPTAEAKFLGPSFEALPPTAPQQELYPWNIDSRSLPDEKGEIEVVFHIQNMSGKHWKPARLVMESEEFPRAYAWEIAEWRDREVVSVHYKFPLDELELRLKRLRVRQVSGVAREAALSEYVAERREAAAIEAGAGEAPIGGTMTEQERRERLAASIDFSRPAGLEIPRELSLEGLDLSTAPAAKALEHANAAHAAALRADSTLGNLIAQIQRDGLVKVLDANVASLEAQRLRGDLEAFSEAAMQLAVQARRDKDPAVQALNDQVTDLSARLTGAADALEAAIRNVEPGFALRG